MPETRLFAVTGRPVFHSLSPEIFDFLFASLGMDAIYLRLAARSGREALDTARRMNIAGMNITAPFKEEVSGLLEAADPLARLLGAVNVAVRRDGVFEGFNTDAEGACRALQAHGIPIKGRRAVVLGAGGAARAAALGLVRGGASRVVIINRTPERAAAAAKIAGCECAPIEKTDEAFAESDLVVSCIPAGHPVKSLGRLAKGAVVMDADYRNQAFFSAARGLGIQAVDGLAWLSGQAAPSFRIMTGREIPAGREEEIERRASRPSPPAKRNIALAGFSGAGKTTVGRLLAERLGRGFVDTDSMIEESQSTPVSEVFRRRGEPFFRTEEKRLIKSLLPAAKETVFSLGGGAILDPESLAVVKSRCHVVWLWVSPSAAVTRTRGGGRPLLQGEHPERLAEKILESRTSSYARASDLVVDSESGGPEEISERIADEVG